MTIRFAPDSDSLPKLHELPPIDEAPKYASWFWGDNDGLGRLNLLTPRRVAAAARLIQTGERVTVNFPMGQPDPPFFKREPLQHRLKQIVPNAFDDVITQNTQSGSQWDGLRHVGLEHNGSYVWYNNTSKQQIETSDRLGLQHWGHQAIAGRGVLLDFYGYSRMSYHAFTPRKITYTELKACADTQGVTFKYGDILIIRTGWSDAYRNADPSTKQSFAAKEIKDFEFAGLDRGLDMVEFLHDNYFAAVAGDAPAFESYPFDEPEHLHHFLLPLWGSPIGEMWDLDALAETCKRLNRYTFFFTSVPNNLKGGVASPPNGVAIF